MNIAILALTLAVELLGVWVVMQPDRPGHHRGGQSHAPRIRHHGRHTRRAVAS